MEEVQDIATLLDFEAIKTKYWRPESDLDLKRRKEAEFLLEQDLPIEAILGYVVFDEVVKQKIIQLGIKPEKIVVRPDYYF